MDRAGALRGLLAAFLLVALPAPGEPQDAFRGLPFDQAVKIERGSGKRQLVLFSDPYCPACRHFEGRLQAVDDITLYIFMIPVIRPDLAAHSVAVWCSRDRGSAWLELVLRGKRPSAKPSCAHPIAENVELAYRLGLIATPTLFFSDGTRHDGGMPIPELLGRLDRR